MYKVVNDTCIFVPDWFYLDQNPNDPHEDEATDMAHDVGAETWDEDAWQLELSGRSVSTIDPDSRPRPRKRARRRTRQPPVRDIASGTPDAVDPAAEPPDDAAGLPSANSPPDDSLAAPYKAHDDLAQYGHSDAGGEAGSYMGGST